MRRTMVSESIGYISDKYVNEATLYTGKERVHSHNRLLKWGAVAACVCLLIVGGLNIGSLFSSRSGCGSQLRHNITLADGKMYYTCNDCVYLYEIDNQTQKEIADFNGVLTQTHSGLYLLDDTGEVYSISGSMLTLLGSITPGSTLVDIMSDKIYYLTYQDDGVYSYSVMEQDLTVGTISEVVTVSEGHIIAQKIVGNKLYYCATENGKSGGIISTIDLQTKESSTIYNSLGSLAANGSELRDVVFYEDLILIETEKGLFSMGYHDKEAMFLSEYVPKTGALDYFDKKLYFIIAVPTDGDAEYYEEELISLSVQTGETSIVTQLTLENGTTQTYTEIVVSDNGYFYTDPGATSGGLFYHSFDGGTEIAICSK